MSSSFEASFNDTQDSIDKAGRVIITIVAVSFILGGIAFVVNLIIHVIRFIIAWKDGVLFSAPYGSLWNEGEYPMVPMGVNQSYQRVVDDTFLMAICLDLWFCMPMRIAICLTSSDDIYL